MGGGVDESLGRVHLGACPRALLLRTPLWSGPLSLDAFDVEGVPTRMAPRVLHRTWAGGADARSGEAGSVGKRSAPTGCLHGPGRHLTIT